MPDAEQAKAAVDNIPLFDTVLFGRRTYEIFEKFWSRADDDSSTAPDPHHPGERTSEHHAIANWLNETTKLVFSSSLKNATWKRSRIVHEVDPGEIEKMKREAGKDMWEKGWKVAALHAALSSKGYFDKDEWELYHVDKDRSESTNLAQKYPAA